MVNETGGTNEAVSIQFYPAPHYCTSNGLTWQLIVTFISLRCEASSRTLSLRIKIKLFGSLAQTLLSSV